MQISKTTNTKAKKAHPRDRVVDIINTFESLLVAFILALVFMQFVMQAFRIPTGSMADTLRGAHFSMRCPQCGYRYDCGFDPRRYGLPEDVIPGGYIRSAQSRCPSCGHYSQNIRPMQVSSGDRILVLKCIYQFFKPKRWDVVVFKNPIDPSINYIKRLIGRPGDTIEIIDGDIYINGEIARKPLKVQDELWMPVYENDYQPIRPYEPTFNEHKWRLPFRNAKDSAWQLNKNNPTQFELDSQGQSKNYLVYDTSYGNDFRTAYAYNDVRDYKHMPYCSDLMMRFYVRPASTAGRVGIELGKYESRYTAWIDFTGEMVIESIGADETKVLASKSIKAAAVNKAVLVKFTNVDHQLIFRFGREELVYDLGRSPQAAGSIKLDIEPCVQILGSGELTLSHIAIFRDIHYTATRFFGAVEQARAVEGNPLTLGEDEFFVLGDNSPNSQDGRWWEEPGKGNNGSTYRKGIVPRDYLVGKALFVYWPSGFELPWPKSLKLFLSRNSRANPLFRIMNAIVSLKCIPNIARMQFIYGGSGAPSHLN
ncbi:MAG: signal peptidase I [Sedimentisphaerales bacterium]|nr:signal peptidase I [Sedimentisphaerales bacterium]